MSMTVGELVGYLDVDDSKFNSKLNTAGSKFTSFAKGVGVAVAAGAVAVGAGIGAMIKTGWDEMSDASAINAQLEAGIKSTGNAAGVTVKEMNDLASSIQSYSGQTDDSIGRTQSLLLTFTKIKNVGVDKIFDRATIAAADMAAKMGTDASASAIQLGKALNDPIGGIASLTRVGIQFTDAQKKSIKAMVEAGDVMGAQKVILDELETQFGGAAKAAGESLPGMLERLKRSFEDVAQSAMERFMPSIMAALGWALDHMPQIQSVVEGVFEGIGDAFSWISDNVWPVLKQVFEDIKTAVGGGEGEGLGGALSGLVGIMAGVRDIFTAAWPLILDAVKMFVEWLGSDAGKALIESLLTAIGTVMGIVRDIFTAAWPIIKSVIETFITWLSSDSGKALIESLLTAISTVMGIVRDVFTAAWPIIESAVQMFINFFNSDAGQALIKTLLDGISTAMGIVRDVFTAAWPIIEGAVQGFISWFNSAEGQAIIKTLIDAVGAAMAAVRTIWEEAWPALSAALKAAQPAIEATLGAIALAVQIVAGAIQAVINAYEEMERMIGSGGNTVNRYGGYTAPGGSTTIYNKGQVPNFTKKNPNLLQRAEGGPIPGTGPIPIIAHGGEYVLTKGDTSLMQRLTAAIAGGMGGGPNITIEKIEIHGSRREGEEAASAFTRRLQALGVVR
jgi:hypothetical protein